MPTIRRVRIVAVQSGIHALPADAPTQSLDILAFLTPEGRLHPFVGEQPARRLSAGKETWSGVLLHADYGWVLRTGHSEDEPLSRLSIRQVRPGEHLTLRDPDGSELVFQVVNVIPAED
jgi:hypothetical protein